MVTQITALVKKIIIDELRAPIAIEMFERVAKQAYAGRDIKRWLDDIDFRSKHGKRLVLSQIYRSLRNPFYYGEFQYPKNDPAIHQGKHKPLISKELWDKVQIQLTVGPKASAGTKEFSFTRMLKCGACKTGITAEEKLKKLKTERLGAVSIITVAEPTIWTASSHIFVRLI